MSQVAADSPFCAQFDRLREIAERRTTAERLALLKRSTEAGTEIFSVAVLEDLRYALRRDVGAVVREAKALSSSSTAEAGDDTAAQAAVELIIHPLLKHAHSRVERVGEIALDCLMEVGALDLSASEVQYVKRMEERGNAKKENKVKKGRENSQSSKKGNSFFYYYYYCETHRDVCLNVSLALF